MKRVHVGEVGAVRRGLHVARETDDGSIGLHEMDFPHKCVGVRRKHSTTIGGRDSSVRMNKDLLS
jgi:hypothetical protein